MKHPIARAVLAIGAAAVVALAGTSILPAGEASATVAKQSQAGGPAGSSVVGKRLVYVSAEHRYSIWDHEIISRIPGTVRIYYRCDSPPAHLITGLQRPADEPITCDGRVHAYFRTFHVMQGQRFDVYIEQLHYGHMALTSA